MTESSQTPPAPSKSKAFLDYFRSRDAPTVTDDAKGATEPASNGTTEPAAVDLTEKRKRTSELLYQASSNPS